MSDENFDPCECVWGHELAMRRLLSLLRNSQSYCTDTECFQDGLPNNINQSSEQSIFFMTLFMAFAVIMFYFRPSAQRNSDVEITKPRLDENGPNGAPPTPPPTSS